MDSKVVIRAIHGMEAAVALHMVDVRRMDPTCKVVVQQLRDLDHGMEAAVKRRTIHIHGMEAGAFV